MLSKTPARGHFGLQRSGELVALAEQRRLVLLVQLRHERLRQHVRDHVDGVALCIILITSLSTNSRT